MRLTLNGFDEDQFRWCFWGASSDDYDDDDAGTFGADEISNDEDRGRDDDNDRVDRVAVVSPNTGQINTQNFNTSAAQTAGMDRVNINGQTVAVAPSAVAAVEAGRGGSSPVTNAIQSQIVGPAQAAQQAPLGSTTAQIQPSFAPNLVNQPLAVGSKVAVMPYDSFQRSPQQMFGYGGLTASPYAPSQISFQGGAPAASYSPLGGERISQFDMGRAPTPAGTPDDRNILERAFNAIGGRYYANQRAGVFDPRTGTFQRFDGQTTLEKTSDNMLGDFFSNAVAGALGVTPFTGRLDTKTYTPLAGGESLQYSTAQGGLLSDMIGEQMIPYSELESRQAQMGSGGDERSDQPLIVPEQTPEEEREQSAFPEFTPREFEYQPFVSQFYTIPSRFTQPYGLLG
jgi:hypothetical protein